MPKILLIDDEDRFRENLAQRLKLRGYETVALNGGQEAKMIELITDDFAAQHNIVCDVELIRPGSGRDFSSSLRASSLFRSRRVCSSSKDLSK